MLRRDLSCAFLVFLFSVSLPAAVVTGKIEFLTKRGQNPNRAETVVWLESAGLKPRMAEAAQVTTRRKALLPHVMAIPIGSTIRFPNEDPITHNLFSVSTANPFDLGLYRAGAGKVQKFDKPGIVNVYCNVHPNMSAVIHVMHTPYYAMTNATGVFQIADVPPGKYKLSAWNEQGGSTQGEIEVLADGTVKGTLNLSIDSRAFRSTPHLNKLGKPYEKTRAKDY